jgi:hypothetical protein
MVDGDRFISGCRFIGGQLRDSDKKIVCDLGNDLKVEMDKKYRDIKVLDYRARPGRNLIDINDIDNIEVDDRRLNALIMYSGDSNVSIGRDHKILTTLQPEFSYPTISDEYKAPAPIMPKRLEREIEACPVGSTQDDRTGVCIPRPEMKREIESRPVLESKFSAVRWSESNDDLILVSDDNAMAKASLGTWLNSTSSLAKSFRQIKRPLTVNIVIGDELKGRTPETGPNYDVRIGRGLYDRRKLYEIAEEAIGEPILDRDRGLPVKGALGRTLPFKMLQSDASDSPIVIKGEEDVFYFLAPRVEE